MSDYSDRLAEPDAVLPNGMTYGEKLKSSPEHLEKPLEVQLVDLQPEKKKLSNCFVSVHVPICFQIPFLRWWLQQASKCLR